jgi:small subunit ribosomal protein S9
MASFKVAVGRRKEASAKVKIVAGKGEFVINGKSALEYLGNENLVKKASASLEGLTLTGKYDVYAKVSGGGKNGQAEAIRHAIARALVKEDETRKSTLRKFGFITRDPRAKERKKYGLKRARKAPQFSKR